MKIFNILGGYNEEYYYSADYDLACRLALVGPVVNLIRFINLLSLASGTNIAKAFYGTSRFRRENP